MKPTEIAFGACSDMSAVRPLIPMSEVSQIQVDEVVC